MYDILAMFDQSWKKKEDGKKIEKYFKSSCLRELKIDKQNMEVVMALILILT